MLPKLTKAQRRELIIRKNSGTFSRILHDSKKAIKLQGTGCYIEDYGVDYIDTKTKYRDSIGVLVPFFSNGKLRRHYGLISDESQKPIVYVIQKTYNVNIDLPGEYARFIRILQELQYAHDESFDNGVNDMKKFVELCSKLEKSIC